MVMTPPRWSVSEESDYPWEREALQFLREHLPDVEPWRAWVNFEFIDDAGRVNEVDALVLSPCGLFLTEIKSRPGDVTGDAATWTWNTDGRLHSRDNPLLLANRKAKRLAGVLKQQQSIIKGKVRLPFIQEVIFLSAQHVRLRLPEILTRHVYLRGRPGVPKDRGMIAALSGDDQGRPPYVDRSLSRTIARAVEEAGIRPSSRHKRVGDYELARMIAEDDTWQDFDGKHVGANVHRRIRVYPFAKATSEASRAALITLASREFRLLQDIDHPGVLRVLDYKESERGPALIFDHDPHAVRLDFVMREHGAKLTAEVRLHFVRQLAETLRYAHEKRLYHRGLSPQCILVRDLPHAHPRLQIMNWHTAVREGSASTGTGARITGTLHPDEYVEDPAKVYLAPEAWEETAPSGPYHDIFSLGAVTYHIFTGTAPATSPLELQEKLRTGNGLQLSDVLDGASQSLQELIRLSTHRDVTLRIGSMDEFLSRLAEVEKELSLPPAEPTVDPADAKAGDRIEGGFKVVARLGRGASADALLVTRSGQDDPLVLKIAIDRQHNDRINNESEILKKLHDHNIVSLRDTMTIAGRSALVLDRAGDETLAQRMRKEPLSLDLIRRFGEELLSAVNYLEQEGVSHRDIKPENIGIARTGQKGQLRLILFDFSLARTSIDNIRAGTRRYLDPFLSLRRPPRWDLAAERYAVAVTLYEMLTGTVPVWGDGRSDAALLDCEATIDEDRFDPQLRDGLSDFFGKAFRRDPKERFDNAEEMLRGWRHVFDRAHLTSIEAHEFSAIARAATANTSVRELGYSVEALNVLDRMGIQTVRQLLAVDRVKFRYLTNVGDRVRKEIRLRAKELAVLRRDLARGQPSIVNGDEDRAAVSSIDRLAEQLLPRRPAGADLPEDRALATYLGMEGEFSSAWPTIGDASSKCDMSREALTSALVKARERWSKQPGITEVRNDLAILLNSNAGVLSVAEAASLLLAARGSVETDGAVRHRLSGAVVRAATEVEAALERPRYRVFLEHVPLIAVSEEAALYALELGDVAEKLADADPPFSPQKVLEALEVVRIPADVPPSAPQRLPKLATAVTSRARLSSRGEIYPVGVGAEQAMRLALGALIGPDQLTVHELNSRIRGRFPEAAPLPDRPELDHLIEQVGIDLKWDETRQAYRRMTIAGSASGTPSGSERLKTEGPAVELTDDVINARSFEEKLAYAFRSGGFLALTCEPRRAAHAEQELLRRFPELEHINFDKLLLDGMTQEAKDKNVDWSIVLKTDAVGRSGRDWPNLLRLVALAAPVIEHQLQTARRPVLLSRPGLIARYDLMPMISRMAADAGTPGHVPLLLLLVPMAVPGLPSIDGTVVPVIGTAQWAIIPDAWVQNTHRAGTRAA